MSNTTYTVSGMTCGHCANAVTSEVGSLTGVREVQVDLATGRVEVSADGPVDDDAVAAAVAEAGYRLADA